jgi:RHS repeat-associated protein
VPRRTSTPSASPRANFDSATGLTKFGTRYYDSSLGRWTQRDPIAGSIANPNAMDRYVYAGDSPVNLTDVGGRDYNLLGCMGLQIGAMAGILGAVVGFTATPVAQMGQNTRANRRPVVRQWPGGSRP